MTVQWIPVLVGSERMRVDNSIAVVNVCVVKEGINPEKPQKKNQEKISGYIIAANFQLS